MLVVLSVTIFARLLGQLGVAVTSRAHEEGVRPLMQRALALAILLGLVGAGLIVAGGALVHAIGLRLALLAAPALIPNIVSACVSGALLGQARIRVWNYIQALPPLLTLVGMLIAVVWLGGEVDAAIAVWTLAYFVTAVFALAVARDLWLPLALPNVLDRRGRAIAGLALVMGTVQIVNLIGYRIELFVLDHYEGLAEVGIYSIAMQAAEAMWLVPAAVATAVTGPAVHERADRSARLIRNACGRGLLYTVVLALGVGSLAPFVVPFLFGEDFRGAVRPLALLLPGVVAYAPVSILVVYLSVRRGRPKLSLLVSAVGLAVTTAMSFVLIPPYGAAGAALASAIGYAAGALAAWLCFVRLAGLRVFGRVRRRAAR